MGRLDPGSNSQPKCNDLGKGAAFVVTVPNFCGVVRQSCDSIAGRSAFSALVVSNAVQFISPNDTHEWIVRQKGTNNQPSSIEPKGDGDVIADVEGKRHHTHL